MSCLGISVFFNHLTNMRTHIQYIYEICIYIYTNTYTAKKDDRLKGADLLENISGKLMHN